MYKTTEEFCSDIRHGMFRGVSVEGFNRAMLETSGMAEHPMASRMLELAWRYGDTGGNGIDPEGYEAVLWCFHDLAELAVSSRAGRGG